MFYVRFIDVNKLPEDDQDRSEYVGVMTNCIKIQCNISAFGGVWCEQQSLYLLVLSR